MTTQNQKINIEEKFETLVRPELDRRIQLVATSIAGGFLSGDNPETTSFRHIINRVMVLVQMPMCFVLHKLKANKLEVQCNFNNHSRDAEQIQKCINRIQNKTDLFQLFGTDYYLQAIVVDKKSGSHDFRTLSYIKGKTPTTTEELATYQLREVLAIDKYVSYGPYFIETLLKPCLERTRKSPKPEPKQDLGIPKKVFKDVGERFDTVLLRNKDSDLASDFKNNGYLDRIFKKISGNLKQVAAMTIDNANLDKQRPTNYLLFLRDYAVPITYSRHFNNYDYQIRIALCERQKEDCIKYFNKLLREKNKKPNGQRFLYSAQLDQHYANSAFKELATDLDAYFWNEMDSKLEENEATRFNGFIKIIEAYFGDESRSVADSVFSDGVVFFRRPFADGGLGRCFPAKEQTSSTFAYPKSLQEIQDNPTKWGEIEKDLKRMVISFYWYQGMVTEGDPDNRELGIMLTPVEVGNRIWCVVGYFTSLYKTTEARNGEGKTIALESSRSAWNNNYLIFQEVSARVKRELRHSMANCYKDMAAYYYASIADPANWDGIYESSTTANDDEKLKLLEQWVNLRLRTLTAYFSHDEIQLEVREGRGSPRKQDETLEKAVNRHQKKRVTPTGKELSLVPSTLIISADNELKKAEKAGVFLSFSHHCAILPRVASRGNYFFPPAPTSIDNEIPYNYVNERDVEVRLTKAYFYKIWQMAVERKDDADSY